MIRRLRCDLPVLAVIPPERITDVLAAGAKVPLQTIIPERN